MIIYVNIDKQNGTVSVDTLEYPGDESLVQFNPSTLLNNENSMSFELHCDESRYAELAGLEMRTPDSEPPIEE
jgi:hypothetical protein